MKVFDPSLLAKWTGGFWTHEPQKKIENFCFDTRKLGKNECFLAIKNAHNDGHNYVEMAEKTGAVATIVEHEIPGVLLPQLVVKNTLEAFQNIAKHYRETLTTKIIGVTGSCGKTTLKELLALLLGDATFKTPENFNNHLGLPFSLTQIDPEIHTNAVIEVGISCPNEMEILLDMLQPDEAILTNVGPAHLGNFDSINAIGVEKFKLLNSTKGNIFFLEEFQNYNHKKDHFYVLSSLQKRYDTTSLTTSEEHPDMYNILSVRPSKVKYINHNGGNIFYALYPMECGWKITIDGLNFHVPFLLGNGAIQNFVLAIAVALKNNVPQTLIQERLQRWQPFLNRGIWKTIGDKRYFIDCYNANPASFADSLQHFYNEKSKNTSTCFVLGSMEELGDASEKYHKKIAKCIALNSEDYFICIGHFCEAIKTGLLARGLSKNQIQCFESAEDASDLLKHLPQKCIYLKGSHCYHLEKLVAEK